MPHIHPIPPVGPASRAVFRRYRVPSVSSQPRIGSQSPVTLTTQLRGDRESDLFGLHVNRKRTKKRWEEEISEIENNQTSMTQLCMPSHFWKAGYMCTSWSQFGLVDIFLVSSVSKSLVPDIVLLTLFPKNNWGWGRG